MVSPPQWLSQFVNAVASFIYAHDVLSPLGCHYQSVNEVCEVTLFASRTEIVGGPQDGRTSDSNFNIDVKGVLDQFSEVESISWQAQPLGQFDELGSHVSIEGLHEDKRVWLRITATAPERFSPGRRALINQQQFEEIW